VAERPPADGSGTTIQLLARARQGDSAALEEVFARAIPLLTRWARGRLPRWARDMVDTDDLVIERTGRTPATIITTDGEPAFRHVEEASRYRDIGELAISPQCGFASTYLGNEITEDTQWRKLEVLVQAAEKIWPR